MVEMLASAQMLLEEKRKGCQLIVYDCLRPRSVQYKMWRLVKETEKEYVADPEKGSIHNFGAAVDVSIVDRRETPWIWVLPLTFLEILPSLAMKIDSLKTGVDKKAGRKQRSFTECYERGGLSNYPG